MRLPQDRILHIDTELAGDEVRVVAEWQGELVRCKDCRQYIPYDLIEAYGWCCEFKTIIEEDESCSRGERRTRNEIQSNEL